MVVVLVLCVTKGENVDPGDERRLLDGAMEETVNVRV